MTPSKSLGQHFLTNQKAITDIVAAAAVTRGDTIIEIGPGTGAITKPLAAVCKEKGAELFAIEKDTRLVIDIQHAVSLLENHVEHGDALELLPSLVAQLAGKSYKLVGNIPYYITGNLLRVIGELDHKPEKIVLMVQKEVAQRVTSRPPHMNLLSAATQYWGQGRILFTLKPKDFSPPPEVSSAIIEIVPESQRAGTGAKADRYYKFIKAAFKQPRKTLLNNLTEGFPGVLREDIADFMRKSELPVSARAQDLDISVLKELSAAPLFQ